MPKLLSHLLQGLRHIQIGCKLQEAAVKYQSEGFSHIYIACVGTDTQKLIDLLETMIGDLDLKDTDPKQLESDVTKALRQEAAKAEEAAVSTTHGPIPVNQITHIPITLATLPAEFGIPPESLPETESVKEASAKNPAKRVTKFDHTCKVCQHSLQNKISMLTHTCRCLKIKLVCQICKKKYKSVKKNMNL